MQNRLKTVSDEAAAKNTFLKSHININ